MGNHLWYLIYFNVSCDGRESNEILDIFTSGEKMNMLLKQTGLEY